MQLSSTAPYPESRAARDAWVLAQRGLRNSVTRDRPYSFVLESERDSKGCIVPVAIIFLTNRECPLRCVMCDLWQNTLEQMISKGEIPRQIDYALNQLKGARQVKLYNSGSFFDPGAIPTEDYPKIAAQVRDFERVIVECHPAFLGERCLRFRDLYANQLEVAIGLETAHETTLNKLNKGMNLLQFERAAALLRREGIALRVFLLVQPPFLDPGEGSYWRNLSMHYALELGATAISLIPTRARNGAMEKLQTSGVFSKPTLRTIEDALDEGIKLERERVFLDLWDLEKFSTCETCFEARRERLREMNFFQKILPRITCTQIGCDSCHSV